MSDILIAQNVSRRFSPRITLGDRLAGLLGANVDRRPVQAVSDVSLAVQRGETLGLVVGESGCGKSTLGRMLAGILAPSEGRVLLDGAAPMARGHKTTTRIQTVFQDPFASLNPRMRIGETIAEGPVTHGLVTRADAPAMARAWLEKVGLDADYVTRFPHQFSGGQRQRVAIARALAMQPEVLVCDEPVASLDVSIQAQILNLFLEAAKVYALPRHPYTKALLDSVPKLAVDGNAGVDFRPIRGELPSPLSPPSGCAFHPRCPQATERCRHERPGLERRVDGTLVACHYA